MCGIVGAVADRDIVPILIEGLKRLEYRGYDSAGVAVLNGGTEVSRLRAVGKVAKLSEALAATPTSGQLGIAHTRWATHGVPNERNAHPHVSRDGVAIVHNGIIENHEELRAALEKLGYESSRTGSIITWAPSGTCSGRCRRPLRNCAAPTRSPSCGAGTRTASCWRAPAAPR